MLSCVLKFADCIPIFAFYGNKMAVKIFIAEEVMLKKDEKYTFPCSIRFFLALYIKTEK